MARKRITEIFPFIIPLRAWQRNQFYLLGLHFDHNHYAKKQGDLLPYEVSSTKTLMVNEHSGYDIVYQKNKIDNLKIASHSMKNLLIYPGEIFSFAQMLEKSRRCERRHGRKFKDGLILINGKIVPQKGGGLCHLSNMLYYLFLMSPLTVLERHGHKVKSLPNPDKDALEGIDATINSGWKDLKVRNDTNYTFQIVIDFDDEYMYGKILANEPFDLQYEIINENFCYLKKQDKIYEHVEVVRITTNRKNKEETSCEKLYDEEVEVTYELPKDITIKESV